MEIVISLLMFLGEPPVLKEQFRCMKVKAVVKDGKIISISSLD